MEGTKFVKAKCKKTGQYYGLEVLQVDGAWKVVNVDLLETDKAQAVASEIKQDYFETHTSLVACRSCQGRRVGGCACPPKGTKCTKNMSYNFQCTYCTEFTIDYSIPSGRGVVKEKIEVQGKEIKPITFSNVKWKKFDKIVFHQPGFTGGFKEPLRHVIAKDDHIEFHGYCISQMNEGVYYVIGKNDDFIIECDVDTSTIQPHPGGHLYITFGLIKAEIMLEGGSFYLGEQKVARVDSKFNMKLSLTEEGKYEIFIDGKSKGTAFEKVKKSTKITFGFTHESHYCSSLSHAYLKNIKMIQAVSNEQ